MIEMWGHTFESLDEIRAVAALEPVALPEEPVIPSFDNAPDLGPLMNVAMQLREILDIVRKHNNILRLSKYNERVRAAKAYLKRENNPY